MTMTQGEQMMQIWQSPEPVLVPNAQCPWAETAVLNPAIVRDEATGVLHMLFRATGPYIQNLKSKIKNQKSPESKSPEGQYPIFLGYAVSVDDGKTWAADFSRPALAPALAEDVEHLWITNSGGEKVVNHANGCIEDPRIVALDGDLYLAAACRMFPPGPYWVHDDPMQCAPAWARRADQPFGGAASENVTVTVVYRLLLDRLKEKKYSEAFSYVGPITDPERGDNRDAFLFPEKMEIDGRLQYVSVHRPWKGDLYMGANAGVPPSIWLSCADRIPDLATQGATHRLLARPLFDWEGDRIGASWPAIRLGRDEWLLAYHGKKDGVTGYTQSFMILQQNPNGWPVVTHRCSDRLMFARHPWELDRSKFSTPCVFTTAGVISGGTLLMAYGAADQKIGIATVPFNDLVSCIRSFDAFGHQSLGG